MNYDQANKILDRTREGWQFSEFVILRALELTGDIEADDFEKLKEKNDKTTSK